MKNQYLLLVFLLVFLSFSCDKNNDKEPQINIDLPTVIIDNISNVSIESAHIVCNVKNNGGAAVTTRGVCWSLEGSPSLENFVGLTDNNDGDGIFIAEIDGLDNNTNYNLCAYAINSKGVAYSEVHQLTTLDLSLAQVRTLAFDSITTSAALLVGAVISSGNGDIISRGFCWLRDGIPNLQNNDGLTFDGNSIGEFSSNISNLESNRTYNMVAYASNEKGTSYGEILSFTTLDSYFASIETMSISNITTSSAECGGNITDGGNSLVYEKGVCWSKFSNPTLENCLGFTSDGTGIGSFESILSDLDSLTVYHVRSYAKNEMGTSYGNHIEFTTLGTSLAHIETKTPFDISETTAYSGGDILNSGNLEILTKGICWSTETNPSLEDNEGFIEMGSGNSSFECLIEGLQMNTSYFVCAYAENAIGISYGDIISFTTIWDGLLVDFVDEDFSSAQSYENINIEGWKNVAYAGDRKWIGKEFSDERYTQATGYNSGLDDMEIWLITPLVRDISSKYLRIKTGKAYWNHESTIPFKVMISTDYTGSNLESATWLQLGIQIADENDTEHQWIDSGEYSLSDFYGNAAIAFIYKGSDQESTSYKIDDVLIE